MQSMKIPYLTALGARRAKHGFGHRTTWAMWVVAVLLASIVIAVPVHRHVSAQSAASVSVTISNEDYETATATIAATGVTYADWIMSVAYETEEYDPPNKSAGPGLSYTPQAAYTFDYTFDSNADTVDVTVTLDRLVPASDYTVTVTVYPEGEYNERVTGTANFTTTSGCYQDQGDYNPATDPALAANGTRPVWFGGHFSVSKREETEITLDVYVTNSGLAGVNEGRCIYYYYGARGGADRGPFSAYVYTKGGGRRAWIKLTELEMGTTYDFTISFHPRVQGRNVGTQVTTKGPRMAVRSVVVDRITLTDARATINVDNETGNSHAVYYRYFKTADTDDSNLHVTGNANTVTNPVVFNLPSLTAGTEYIAEASLEPSFPTNRTEFDIFPTKLNKPTGLGVTPGDGQLELGWTKPAGGDAIDEYIVQWKSGSETFADAETENREQTVVHVSGTTTYDATIPGLENGTEYTVQVIAKNDSGQAISDTKTGIPATLPDAPKNLDVAPGSEKLALTWEAPDETGGINITGYKVQWKDSSVADWNSPTGVTEVSVSGLTREITGLTNGTTYDVRVRADNGVTSDDYNWAVDDGTPRPEPIVTGVTVADTSITRATATATVAIDNQTSDSQTVHLHYRKTAESGWTDVPTKDTAGSSETFDLSSLTGNTEYVVEAWLAATPNTKESATFTTDPVEPDAPRNVRITGHGDRELTVAWDAPSDSGGSQITGYKVQWKSGTDGYDPATRQDEPGASPHTIDQLANGTEYTVQVIAVTTAGDGSPSTEAKGTPSRKPDAPIIQSVTPGHTQLVVNWSEPANGGNPITNYKIEYKEQDAQSWRLHKEVDHNTLTETIGSLTNGTIYVVQVSAKNINGYGDPSVEEPGTPRPDPSVTSVTVAEASITQTAATATVTIDNQTDESQMVHLRYRVNSSSEAWTTPVPQSTTDVPKEFPLSSLKSDTEYRVEASLDSAFNSGVQFKLFTTKRPTVSSVEIDENTITQAGATATVTIMEPNGRQQTVRLKYRPHTQDDWSTTATDAGEILVNTSTDVAAVPISDLKSGTLYEVEASLESDYSQSATTTFTTEGPSLTGITISEVMQESAKATIGIEAPNGQSLAIFVRHRKVTNPVNEVWTRADTSSIDTTALAPLSDLTSGTEYEVQASLDNTFPAADTISKTFPTHNPSLSGLTVMGVTLTGATLKVGIEAHNGESQAISYRYRPVTQTDWTTTATDAGADSTTSTTESAEFTLASLRSGIQYLVQASLDSNLDSSTATVLEATFTTLTPDPSISDVAIDAKQTTAKATITIANPGTSDNTVHLHFRVQNTNAWSSPALTSTTSTTETTIDMTSLTERTTYEVEVALNSGFTSSTIVTFTTLVTPTITSVSVDDVTKTTATATVAIANPDGTDRPVHLRYREKDASPVATWTTDMEDSDTGSQEFDLLSLKPGTTYEVEASFDSNFVTGVEDTEFTTTYAPSISSVNVGSITKTTATATVSIANPDDTSRTVHLQYRVKDADPEDTWTKAMEDTDTGSQEFGLTGLTPGTTYEVQASFDSSFSPHKDTTFTTVFEPSISGVSVGSIEKTTATATVIIANPDGTNKTVNLQYREYNQTPEAEWTKPTPKDTSAGSETFDLTSLTPGTTYEAQASFDSNFDTYKDTTFTTKFAPTISAVSVGSITKTTAVATVTIANPDGTTQTVQLQYRIKDPQGNWSSTQTENTTTGSATINLTGLTAGTTYDVEVSLASGFGSTQTATFTTKYEPSISSVSMGSVTQTTASAAISIDNADGSTQTVHLQYREKDATPQASWMSAQPVNSTTSAASIPISGLTADTTYEVEAWLANDTAKKVTATFTTLEAPNGTPTPSVSSVGVGSITQTTATATVNMANPGTAQNTVNLRYSVEGENDWTDKEESGTGSTVAIGLSSLTASTTYEVEAWLSTDTSKKVTATFTTSPAPSISSISVGSITRTSASATVNIANPGTAQNTVNLRYSVDGEDSWTDHTKTETGSTVAFPLSSLTAGTTYEVEAWLGNDTDNKATATFTTTLPAAVLSPTINSVRVGNILETTATATVNIDNADGSTQTAKLQYRTTNPQGNWSSTYENTSTTGTATINFGGMTAGTRYQVQAWLASDASDKATASFQTQQAAPNNPPPQRSPVNPTPPVTESPEVASVSITNETQTTADATVKIDNAGTAQNTVNLRYSVDGEDSWTDHTKTETGSTVEFPLSSLTAGTTYEVEAWLGNDTDNKVTATFTTSMAPSISSISVGGITKTSATATVNMANHGDAQNTVNLRYSVDGEDSWTDHTKTETGSTVEFPLSSLTAGTTYEVEAWLGSATDNKVTATFMTIQAAAVTPPSISSVRVLNIAQTSARVVVGLANANAEQRVYLKYKLSSAQWPTTSPQNTTHTNGSATFILSSLTAGTGYHVRVSLNSDMSDATTRSFTTTSPPPPQRSPDNPTPPATKSPEVSSVTFINIMQTSAVTNVSIKNAGTAQKTVRLHYRADGTTAWSTPPKSSTTKSSGTTIALTGLTAGTTYEVQVWLNSGTPPPGTQIYEFTTLDEVFVAEPAIASLQCENIGQTSATAIVVIADAGTGMKEVFLKHSIQGEDEWTMLPFPTITYDDDTSIPLTGLTEGTTYEVVVALSEDFSGMFIEACTTLVGPSLSGVSISGITQTSAVATVNIADAGTAQKTVSLRHRRFGETEWYTARAKTTTAESAAFDLTGLSPQTKYEVEAALSSDFTDSATATFTTLSPDPRLSNVIMRDIKQTTATAAIEIADPGDTTHTVYLHYRTTPQGEWSETQTANSNTVTIEKEESDGEISTIVVGRAGVSISGLTADTEYEVHVSLDSEFGDTVSAPFTTLRYPSISDVDVTDITKTTATSKIDIADPDGSRQTVHLRYRTTTPQGDWSGALTTTSTTAEASVNLTGLITDTEYEVEVSLTSGFTVSETDTFRTLPPDPVVSKVSVNSIRQTTATAAIDIANTNGSTQTVSLRYRTTTPRGNWSGIKTATSTTDNASIDLSGLTPGTEYDVQASLDSSFPATRTKSATFTTLRWPSISSFEVENIGRNGATVSAAIADSRGVAQTVYVRHRATGYIAWRPTQQVDSVDDIASLRLRGLTSGTEYVAEASLGNSFPDGGTRSVTFSTKERDDDDAVDSDIVISTTRTTNVPLLGVSPQMLRFVAIEGGDNPSPQTFSVWNRAPGSMSFNLSNHEEWLSQQPMSGVSNGPEDLVAITASVDSSELASGQYVDVINIDVTSSGKSPGQVIVLLDVLPPDYIRQFVSRDEGGVVVLPDGTVKLIVEPLSPPRDVDIELMKLNLQAHGQPPGEQERVVVAIESNTYEPGGDTPEDVAYTPYVELWVQLPQEDAAACNESRARVYSVQSGDWSLIEHRCETDESDKVWAVAQVERLGAFALVIDDAPVSPTPTPVAAAVAATATAIPASAPAVAVQRISLPAQPPPPVPTSVPTAVPMPNGKTTVAPAMAPTPTPTAVPAGNEPSAPMMQASAGDGGSGGFGRIILAALGVPMLIGTLIIVYLLYRERRRRDDARMI